MARVSFWSLISLANLAEDYGKQRNWLPNGLLVPNLNIIFSISSKELCMQYQVRSKLTRVRSWPNLPYSVHPKQLEHVKQPKAPLDLEGSVPCHRFLHDQWKKNIRKSHTKSVKPEFLGSPAFIANIVFNCLIVSPSTTESSYTKMLGPAATQAAFEKRQERSNEHEQQ